MDVIALTIADQRVTLARTPSIILASVAERIHKYGADSPIAHEVICGAIAAGISRVDPGSKANAAWLRANLDSSNCAGIFSVFARFNSFAPLLTDDESA